MPTTSQKTVSSKKAISLKRAAELQRYTQSYSQKQKEILTGIEAQEEIKLSKKRILDLLGATEKDWEDWRWQLRNRIGDVKKLAQLINLSPGEIREIEKVGQKFRWSISPYYASLLINNDPDCPIRKQSIPSILELVDGDGKDDPMGEEFTSPAPCITRRYPDRLIINVTNQCAMYCRHCQRRRNIGKNDSHSTQEQLEVALAYIRKNPEIRDVLITGGDALMLSDQQLDWLLSELNAIPHVEIKRLGTRTLVTLPQRITPELCQILEKHPPIYLNTQFNHPREITTEVASACDRLVKSGVVLGNQAVLLKEVNNDVHIMKKLNQQLLRVRIRPYYIFHAKQVIGTGHFITSIEEGLEIIEGLRGFTSGLAVPTYILNAPQGYGKIPLLPRYLMAVEQDQAILRTWEGRIIHYANKITKRESKKKEWTDEEVI